MTSEASSNFWKSYEKLTREMQFQAKKKYEIWKGNPFHPGLEFKCVNAANKIWSVRINDSFRAIGIRPDDSLIIWFWIGDHTEYLRLIK